MSKDNNKVSWLWWTAVLTAWAFVSFWLTIGTHEPPTLTPKSTQVEFYYTPEPGKFVSGQPICCVEPTTKGCPPCVDL